MTPCTSSARTDAEITGLDALEIAGRDKEVSRGARIWAATWPKLAALAIAIAALAARGLVGLEAAVGRCPARLEVGRELVEQA